MEEKKTINWEDDYNCWFCGSDDLLEGLMVNSTITANGIIITIDEATYKITRPDSIGLNSNPLSIEWVVEPKSSDQTVNEIAKITHGQCNEMCFEAIELGEVLSTLVKNTREILQLDAGQEFEGEECFAAPSIDAKNYVELAFSESKFLQVAVDGKALLENTRLCYATKVYVFKDVGMVKLELSMNCMEVTPLSVESLGLTYDSTLSVNFFYEPDYLAVTNNPNMSIYEHFSRNYIRVETNQDGDKMTFASNYVLDLVNKYIRTLIEYRTQIERNVKNHFFNVCFFETALEMGTSPEETAGILCVSNNDVCNAIELLNLASHEYIEYYIEELTKEEFMCQNFLVNLANYLKHRLERCTSYCISCGKKLPDEAFRLSPCSSEFCMFKFEEIFGVKLCTEMQNNADLIELDLSLAVKAIFSARAFDIFEPFPSFFLYDKENRDRSVFGKSKIVTVKKENKNIGKMREILSKLPTLSNLKPFSAEDDIKKYLATVYREPEDAILAHKLVTYIIATNRLSLVKLKGKDQVQGLPEGIIQFIVTSLNPEFERKFDINKKRNGSTFLFHGSSIENWYSILRNGIKVLSNTQFMTAGAAHGAGIYCSDQFMTSLGYSMKHSFAHSGGQIPGAGAGWAGDLYPNYYIMGIIECITESNRGSYGVACIPKEDHVALRYVLLIPSSCTNGSSVSTNLGLGKHYYNYVGQIKALGAKLTQERILKEIAKAEKMIIKKENEKKKVVEEEKKKAAEEEKIQSLEKIFTGKGSATASKRLFLEYRALTTSKEFKDVKVSFKEDNAYVWRLVFDILKFDLSKELKSDFEKIKTASPTAAELEFEIIFSQDFPYDPPFIRIVRPRFMFHTGHITIGGSICMQVLTKSGWTVAISLENLFIDIITTICLGGGRIDLAKWNIPYTLQEAKEAFMRVARDHGWLKA